MNSHEEDLVRQTHRDLIDGYDEELELELEDLSEDGARERPRGFLAANDKEYRRHYFRELLRL